MINLIMVSSATPGAYYAFQASDGMGKSIVILLLFASVVTWSLMIDKWWSLYKAKKMSELFITNFNQNHKSINVLVSQSLNDNSPVAKIYLAGVEKLQDFTGVKMNNPNVQPFASKKLTTEELNAIEAVLDREVSHEIMQLETGVSFLATIVSVCPFLGLFGTVWGVMLAFVGMAQQGSADIGAMAPGIASALLTTVVGLVVAIPSVIGYNLITANIKNLIVYMDNFAEAFVVRMKLDQINKDNNL